MKRIFVISACVCVCLCGSLPVRAQWATEHTQILNHIELVTQYARQLQQYAAQLRQLETQIQQYENMVTNTMAPYTYVWDQVRQTMARVMGVYQQIQQFENMNGGSLEGYLSKFADATTYANNPCFGPGGCTQAQLDALAKSRNLGSSSQLLANNALFQSIKQAQTQIQQDAATVKLDQQQAQSATGRMQAIQAGNQLAGEQAMQLLQIRALLVAQAQAQGAKLQNDANTEAQKDAGDAQLERTDPSFAHSSGYRD